MNTFGLRPEFQIPIAVRDIETLRRLGVLDTNHRKPDGSESVVRVKPLSAMFPHFAGGAALISSGADITVTRYKEIVDAEQLWISPKTDGYRKVFEAWYPGQAPLPKGYDVDHALSKALADRLGYPYVRLTLVQTAANRSAGSSGEKLGLGGLSPDRLSQLARDPILYADPSDLAKLFNVSHGNATLQGVAEFHSRNPFIFASTVKR